MSKEISISHAASNPLPIAKLKRVCRNVKMTVDTKEDDINWSPLDPALRTLCAKMYSIMTPVQGQQTAENAGLVYMYTCGLMSGHWGVIAEIKETQMMAATVIFFIVIGHHAYHDLMDDIKPIMVNTAFKTTEKYIIDAINEAQRMARSDAATHAANASHATHKDNKRRARDWYAEHRTMTKDAAAEKMAKDDIVHASFRTIRGYLTGQ